MMWTRKLIQILKWQDKWKTRKVWQLKHKNEIDEHKQQFWFFFFNIYIFFSNFFFVRWKSEWWTRRIWYLWTFGPFKRNLALITTWWTLFCEHCSYLTFNYELIKVACWKIKYRQRNTRNRLKILWMKWCAKGIRKLCNWG